MQCNQHLSVLVARWLPPDPLHLSALAARLPRLLPSVLVGPLLLPVLLDPVGP